MVTTTARTGTPALAGFALAVLVGHHLGALPGGLGDAGGSTRWVDWIDLLTPYAVVGAALLVLRGARAGRGDGVLAAVGAVAYVQGHGLHLAANSVGNARGDGAPVHLRDEVVGHYVWYAGLALLVVALARAARGARLPTGTVACLLAVGVGVTWATNALEGGTAVASLVTAVALALWGWRRGDDAGRLLLVAYLPAVLVLAAYGLWQGGFPQPSEVGLP